MALTSTTDRVIQQGANKLVTENHVDLAGVVHVWTYEAALGDDTVALLASHKTQLEQELADAEAGKIING